MPTESNRSFGLVISGLGEGGAGGCSLRQSKCIWFDVELEIPASNNGIGCNFRPFRGHKFMTSTKNDQLCDPELSTSAKNEQ